MPCFLRSGSKYITVNRVFRHCKGDRLIAYKLHRAFRRGSGNLLKSRKHIGGAHKGAECADREYCRAEQYKVKRNLVFEYRGNRVGDNR